MCQMRVVFDIPFQMMRHVHNYKCGSLFFSFNLTFFSIEYQFLTQMFNYEESAPKKMVKLNCNEHSNFRAK